MRNLILSTIATVMIILTATMTMNAQQQYDIKVRPVALLNSDFKVSAEFLKSERIGFEFNTGYNTGERLVNFQTYEERGFELGAAAKYYFRPKTKADGYYGSMYGNYINTSFTNVDEEAFRNNQLNIGFMVGYKKVYQSGFFFEYGIGLGQSFVNENTAIGDSNIDVESIPMGGLKMPMRFSVGFRF